MLDKLNKASFDPHLKSKFEITPEGMDMVEVELMEVEDKSTKQVETFSLLFKGPKEKEFGQGTHGVKHPKMGEFSLFLVPIVYPKTDAMYYQAIFSRLLQDED